MRFVDGAAIVTPSPHRVRDEKNVACLRNKSTGRSESGNAPLLGDCVKATAREEI